MVAGSVITARILRWPWHRGQTRTSVRNPLSSSASVKRPERSRNRRTRCAITSLSRATSSLLGGGPSGPTRMKHRDAIVGDGVDAIEHEHVEVRVPLQRRIEIAARNRPRPTCLRRCRGARRGALSTRAERAGRSGARPRIAPARRRGRSGCGTEATRPTGAREHPRSRRRRDARPSRPCAGRHRTDKPPCPCTRTRRARPGHIRCSARAKNLGRGFRRRGTRGARGRRSVAERSWCWLCRPALCGRRQRDSDL